MANLPGSILFACDRNTIRSPMAAAIMRHIAGQRVYVDSAGLEPDENGPDGFAVAAMQEVGLDIATHHPKGFDEVGDGSVDLIIAFTPQAKDRAAEFTRTLACDVEYWPVAPSGEGFRQPRGPSAGLPGGPGGPFSYIRERFVDSDEPV